MKKIIILILFIFTEAIYANSVDTSGLYCITGGALIETVKHLASEKLQGRLSGSPGFYQSAEYMKNEFKKLNLKPLFENDYYQYFNTEYNDIKCPCRFSLLKNNTKKEYKIGKDYIFRGFTGSGNIKAPVVFCGYGFSADDYDDYAGVDVKGKIVLIFKQLPAWRINDKDWNNSLRYREKIAFDHGAIATLLVSKPNDKSPQKPIGSVLEGEGEMLLDYPHLQIDISVADEFLFGSGFTLKDLQTAIDSIRKPKSFEINSAAEVEINAVYEKDRKTMNTAGIIEGSDPVLKNEYLIIGAHLDHVGAQGEEIYFPGANDNASGSSAVLQIARAFVKSGFKPSRSIVFVLFSNEESGLHGSTFFCNNFIAPLEKVTAMFNLDCIGYGDSIQVGNGKSAPDLWGIAKNINDKCIGLMVERTWNGGGADAQEFHNKKIPCLYFVTTNSYDHLHLTTDKTETLNLWLFERITKLAFLTAKEVAGGNYKREIVKQ
ncbi:M20/M25/M40 family metallo-hydrolase [bacterium]|nr:MAG: M20/M25/M40 family metallo-hydrolase [bacterium]